MANSLREAVLQADVSAAVIVEASIMGRAPGNPAGRGLGPARSCRSFW